MDLCCSCMLLSLNIPATRYKMKSFQCAIPEREKLMSSLGPFVLGYIVFVSKVLTRDTASILINYLGTGCKTDLVCTTLITAAEVTVLL